MIAGRYRVTSILGVGGMGSVFRAEHTGIGRPVAVKLLHREFAEDPTFAKRFEREAFVTGRSAHPNCVNVSDFGRLDDGTLYLVMELVDGDSLAEILESDTRIEWGRALRIVRHVLRGLGHAHAASIVHRDVKPENVIIVSGDTDPDYAKILDFGIAKLIGDSPEAGDNQLTQFGTTVGTPNYVAPEQALGQAVDGRSDLYSLSVMLYEMITGSPPFYSDDTLKVLSMHVATDVPAFADRAPELNVPAEVEALVRRGLEKGAAKRYTNADDYIAAIDAIIGAAPPRAQTPLPLPRAATPIPVTPPESAPAETAPAAIAATAPAQTAAGTIGGAEPVPPQRHATAPPTHAPHTAQRAESVAAVATAATDFAMTTPVPGQLLTLTGIPTTSRVPRRKIYIGAGVTLVVVFVIAFAAGGGPDSTKDPTTLTPPPTEAPISNALLGPPKPGKLAQQAEDLMARGDPQATVALLEKNADDAATDPYAQLQLGHAKFALGKDGGGLAAYEQAIKLYSDLRDNDKVRANAGIAATAKDPDTRLRGLRFQSVFLKEDSAKTLLAKVASSEKDLDTRKRAREIAVDLDILDRVDLVKSYSMDLAQEKECEIKKQLVIKLKLLNDKRAIKPIKRARNRSKGGFLGWRARRVNKCLRAEADDALAHLKKLPD